MAKASSTSKAANSARKRESTGPGGQRGVEWRVEALRGKLIQMDRRQIFSTLPARRSAKEAIFTRKVGHTQCGVAADFARPGLRGSGAKAGTAGGRSTTPPRRCNTTRRKRFHGGLRRESLPRDCWFSIHARKMHPSLYDAKTMKPSVGMDYLMPIFTDAITRTTWNTCGWTLFAAGIRSRIIRSR